MDLHRELGICIFIGNVAFVFLITLCESPFYHFLFQMASKPNLLSNDTVRLPTNGANVCLFGNALKQMGSTWVCAWMASCLDPVVFSLKMKLKMTRRTIQLKMVLKRIPLSPQQDHWVLGQMSMIMPYTNGTLTNIQVCHHLLLMIVTESQPQHQEPRQQQLQSPP